MKPALKNSFGLRVGGTLTVGVDPVKRNHDPYRIQNTMQ